MPTPATALLQWGRKGQPSGYHNHFERYPQFYGIAVTAGRLHLQRPGMTPLDLAPGSAVLLGTGAVFTLSTPYGPYAGHFIDFSLTACRWPRQVLVLAAHRRLHAVVAEIEAEYATGADPESLALLYRLLARRLLLLAPQQDGSAGAAAGLHARLRANLQTDTTIADIIGGPSEQRQARRQLAAAGLSPPKRLLQELKLDEARRMLRTSRLTVTTVAFELGFPSSQHFATCYRRRFGLPPSRER